MSVLKSAEINVVPSNEFFAFCFDHQIRKQIVAFIANIVM